MTCSRKHCILGYSTCSVPFWTQTATAVTTPKKHPDTVINSEVYSSHFIKNFDLSKGLINSLWLAEILIAYRKDFLHKQIPSVHWTGNRLHLRGLCHLRTIRLRPKGTWTQHQKISISLMFVATNHLNAQNALRFFSFSDMWRVNGTERTSGGRFKTASEMQSLHAQASFIVP